jgi:hypothetical protein
MVNHRAEMSPQRGILDTFDLTGLSHEDSLKLIERVEEHIKELATNNAIVGDVMEEAVRESFRWECSGHFTVGGGGYEGETPSISCTLRRSAPLDKKTLPAPGFSKQWTPVDSGEGYLEVEVCGGEVVTKLHDGWELSESEGEAVFGEDDLVEFDHEKAEWIYGIYI